MSKKIFFRSVLSIFLIFCISLINVNIALADDSTPPPATEEPTEELTQPGIETVEPAATETPTVDESPSNADQVPADEEASPSTLFSQVPEETSIVVLDENGNPVPLVSQDGLDVILEDDPMWCPGTTPPGGVGCMSFTGVDGITDLLADMQLNTDLYDQNGTIYFTSNPGNGSFTLTNADDSLSTDYALLSGFDLILQGGWNGSTVTPQYNTTTNFGSNSITIGTVSNPWVGNITLSNFTFSGVSTTNAVTVYTTNGDITLNNVDVAQQAGGNYTANLVSSSGDITVQNGSTFDGHNTGGDTNQGFSATTNTGSITITGTAANPITFTDADGNTDATNYNGASLSAPSVSLTYVTSTGNDLNGIYISNANTVSLTNVVAGGDNATLGNGTNPTGPNNSVGSGVYIQGPAGGTSVSVTGGYFARNERYGIEITGGSITIVTAPTYGSGGNSNGLGTLYLNTPPVLNLPANITTEATSASGATVTFSVTATDAEDNPDPTPTCTQPSGSVFAIATTTVSCSVTDSKGVSTSGSFTVTIGDTTKPVIAAHVNVTAEATSASGAIVTYTSPATSDLVDGAGIATCAPASGSTFALGNTTVTCNATDVHGNIATPTTFTVTVQDTTAPVLNLPANMTVEATSLSGALVTYSASASDAVDASVSFSCAPISGIPFAMGITKVNCSATDDYNNTSNGSFTVTVRDTSAPSLTLPANITTEATGSAGAIVTYTASAFDALDGTLPVICSAGSGNTFALGMTTVNCSATDTQNNISNGSFSITVQDTTKPVIAAHVDVTAEATGSSGAVVSYTNSSTTDIVDGSGSATCAPASSSTFALGDTIVICNATDTHGNVATPTTFTVSVVDTIAPALNLPANMAVEVTGPTGASVTYSASAADLVDGPVSISCVPASGTIFALGTATVNCSATDASNNTANGSFTISVQDTAKPIIAAHGNITAEATSASGAAVTYTSPATSDLVDGAGIATCAPASGSTFALGNTTVTCNATDAQSNVATPTTFTVTVQDTTAPTLNLPANMTVEATSLSGALVTYSASASDAVDASVSFSCAPISGIPFTMGTTTVNCSATDDYNNTSNGSFTVTVQDTTAPVIGQLANITMVTTNISKKAVVSYQIPTTTDAVDGAGFASCTPAPGNAFPVGNSLVTCTAVDAHGNAAVAMTFTVTVKYIGAVNAGNGGSSNGNSLLIPVTGDETIALDCNTQVMLPGVKVTFYNLCDRQAILRGLDASALPGNLPAGFTFVTGLTVSVLNQNQLLEPLPMGSGIEMDFTTTNSGKYAVLFWDHGNWVEISQLLSETDITAALSKDASNELYKITSSENSTYRALTTRNTGIFVLVKK